MIYKLWRKLLATFRLSESAICEMSVGLPPHNDYHDYGDDVGGMPWHFCEMTCKRCDKKFYI